MRRRTATRAKAVRSTDDAGFSMLEIVVTMTIMAIVLVLFTAGMQQVFAAENRVDSATSAESQITIAFQRLDKEIRYASGVSNPGAVGADQYVEILSTYSGTAICTEIRLHTSTQQLQQRTWTQGTTPLVPTSWVQLASSVSSTAPFTVSQADSTYNFLRMQVKLVVTSGAGPTATSKASDITFTALNTTLTTSSSTTCTEGRTVA